MTVAIKRFFRAVRKFFVKAPDAPPQLGEDALRQRCEVLLLLAIVAEGRALIAHGDGRDDECAKHCAKSDALLQEIDSLLADFDAEMARQKAREKFKEGFGE